MSSENMPFCTLPELVNNWATYCLLVPVHGRIFTISLEASFNNSKYFKTAVKSTVTISSKIVSHEKNSF